MKKSKFLIQGLVVLSLLIVSCNTSDDDIQCEEDITGVLSLKETEFVGEWELIAIESFDAVDLTDDDVDNPSTDIFSQYSECERNQIYEFKNDRAFTLKQGYTLPDCNNSSSFKGTWELTDGNTLITVAYCSKQSAPLEFENNDTEFKTERSITIIDINKNSVRTSVTTSYRKM